MTAAVTGQPAGSGRTFDAVMLAYTPACPPDDVAG